MQGGVLFEMMCFQLHCHSTMTQGRSSSLKFPPKKKRLKTRPESEGVIWSSEFLKEKRPELKMLKAVIP